MANIPFDIEKKLKAVLRKIEEVLAFDVLEDNFNDSTSLKTLCNVSGMSERSLRDWFKTYTGINISHYCRSRRAEYAARILRLYPSTSKSEVARIIGLNSSTGLYPFLRKIGINKIDSLKNHINKDIRQVLKFRIEYLPESVLFYTFDEIYFSQCSKIEFEENHWNKIESFVSTKFPNAIKNGDVGYAIDRYIVNKQDEGIFIAGILYKNVPTNMLPKNFIGDIGWKLLHRHKYAVFSYKGDYNGLSDYYLSAIYTLQIEKTVCIEKSFLIMEKYLNSPLNTHAEDLITEIWIPLI